MRIAQVAPLWYPVPPAGYGGTEQVVSLLTEELIRRGHEVTLFASGDSTTKAKLVAPVPKNLVSENIPWLSASDNLRNLLAAFESAPSFDIIHTHIDVYDTLFPPFVSTPAVATLHNPFWPLRPETKKTYGDRVRLYEDRRDGNYVAISEAYRQQCPVALNWTATVHHGIQLPQYRYNAAGGDAFVWIGRVASTKGLHIAAQLAAEQNEKLLIAGKIITPDAIQYWNQEVQPFIEGERIRSVGELTTDRRSDFLGSGKAMLFPLQWEEPFGLTMIEAMACGTPVIAFRRGSVPEIVMDGVTGFIVDTVEEMAGAMKRIDQIDRRACRKHVEENFTVEKMVERYETVYGKLLRS